MYRKGVITMSKIKKISAIALVMLVVVSVFSACAFSPEAKLIGAWRDSTGNVGYEFKENNVCAITYVDFTIPFINMRITDDIQAAYTTEKKDDGNYYITLTYNVFAKNVTETYTFKVDGDVLTLTNPQDGSIKTFIRYVEPTTAPATTVA